MCCFRARAKRVFSALHGQTVSSRKSANDRNKQNTKSGFRQNICAIRFVSLRIISLCRCLVVEMCTASQQPSSNATRCCGCGSAERPSVVAKQMRNGDTGTNAKTTHPPHTHQPHVLPPHIRERTSASNERTNQLSNEHQRWKPLKTGERGRCMRRKGESKTNSKRRKEGMTTQKKCQRTHTNQNNNNAYDYDRVGKSHSTTRVRVDTYITYIHNIRYIHTCSQHPGQ